MALQYNFRHKTGEGSRMPKIYTSPVQISSIVDNQASARSSTLGSLSDITDGDKYAFYETMAPGTAQVNPTRNELRFNLTFNSTTSVDTIYVLAQNIDSITFSVNPGGDSLGTRVPGQITYDNRRGVLSNVAVPVAATGGILRLIKTPATSAVRIYEILVMRQLLNLSQSNNMAITRYNVTRQIPNAFVQEDLYGARTLQTGHLNSSKKTINYRIWQNGNTLTECRNELSKVYNIQRQHSNFTIWDLDEPNAQDYESVYQAHWVPNSFAERIEGTQAISYGFSIEEE